MINDSGWVWIINQKRLFLFGGVLQLSHKLKQLIRYFGFAQSNQKHWPFAKLVDYRKI